MLFNSIEFLLFFPIVLLVYFVLPSKIRYIWLLVTSYYFYMCWNPVYILLLIISTAITYCCGLIVGKIKRNDMLAPEKQKFRMKFVILVSFLINLGILVYFKYLNFLIDIINPLLNALHLQSVPAVDILLPVGISFYTFQALGYTIDVYRGQIEAEKNPLKYALFVSFFPQLVAGPIERSKNLLNQIHEEAGHKLWNYHRITSGLVMMLWGFFMKVVIADRIAVLVNNIFENYGQYQMFGLAIGALAFMIQIYCDFSGYSTIAIGAAKVLGFELMENFEAPFLSKSVAEFWRRWHISLSTWFRDYLYFPLGGSRCRKLRHYCNLLITFGVSGLWHGANWTYVIWGLTQGIFQIAEKELSSVVKKIHRVCHTRTDSFGYKLFQVICVNALVSLSGIFFRAESVYQAYHYIRRMVTYHDWWSMFDGSLYTMGLDAREMNILFVALACLFLVDWLRYKKNEMLCMVLDRQWIVFRWAVLLFLLFYNVVFGYYGANFESAQFIYFQF